MRAPPPPPNTLLPDCTYHMFSSHVLKPRPPPPNKLYLPHVLNPDPTPSLTLTLLNWKINNNTD